MDLVAAKGGLAELSQGSMFCGLVGAEGYSSWQRSAPGSQIGPNIILWKGLPHFGIHHSDELPFWKWLI